tara:strand:- start:3139 stop:4215 length:1077 start_codon:yes stop_codon:yes gene_type:complete
LNKISNEKLKQIIVFDDDDISHVAKVMEEGEIGVALVCDKNSNVLIGIVTDGDLRRYFITPMNADVKFQDIYKKKPVVANKNKTKKQFLDIITDNKIKHLPVVDDFGIPVELIISKDDSIYNKIESTAVILVGGLGTRLRPLTDEIPKPMLNIGTKPILEMIIENLRKHNISDIVLSTHYKENTIREYFKTGEQFDMQIKYYYEKNPMGTAGCLKYIENLTENFILLNGDILTNIDHRSMLNYHLENDADITIASKKYTHTLPFGEIITNKNDNLVSSIHEKPSTKHIINAGVFIIKKEMTNLIPYGVKFDSTDLINSVIEKGFKVQTYDIDGYWIDIGTHQNYYKAVNDSKEGNLDL